MKKMKINQNDTYYRSKKSKKYSIIRRKKVPPEGPIYYRSNKIEKMFGEGGRVGLGVLSICDTFWVQRKGEGIGGRS